MNRADVLDIHPFRQGVDFNYDWHHAGNAHLFSSIGVIGPANLQRGRR